MHKYNHWVGVMIIYRYLFANEIDKWIRNLQKEVNVKLLEKQKETIKILKNNDATFDIFKVKAELTEKTEKENIWINLE